MTSQNKRLKLLNRGFKAVLKSGNVTDILQSFGIKRILKVFKSRKIMTWIINNDEIKNEYDIVISFRNDGYKHTSYYINGCSDFVLNCTRASCKIAWIHNDPDADGLTYDIAREVFEKFDYIVNVSKGCKDRFDKIIPEYKNKSKLVHNTFNYDEIIKKSIKFNLYQDNNKVKLVTVERVVHSQKRMDRIVKVCKMLKIKI
ncbi:MAG: hypothetical protein ACRCSG_03800 [Cellulosilyticaceae bacterium]